jgi:murein DD-endopeptidase MepM/ murein hydrolase activator NlpD
MIEIQIHPSDIRRKVRYFFFDRRTVAVATALLAVVLFLVVSSMAAAPSVIRRAYKIANLNSMRAEQARERERLRHNVEMITSLEKSLDEQRVRVEKLLAVYGLDEEQLGLGGVRQESANARSVVSRELNDARSREQHLRLAVNRVQKQLELIARFEAANAEMVRHTPSILPLPTNQFVLTSPFGSRISPFTRAPDFHKGLDLAAPTGTPVYAAGDGIVTFAGRFPIAQSVSWWRFGEVVVVRHADRFITIYAHCDTTLVKPGQSVRQGQQIATVGSSGWSTNSHLHYEVRTDIERPGTYEPIDPRIYILNYQWNNEEKLLIQRRTSKDYRDLDPLPPAFIGRRRA